MSKLEYLLDARAKAAAIGDRGIYRALTADLARLGYIDPPTGAAMETTAIAAPERAVPPSKSKRPAAPRCQHGNRVGRCAKCRAEDKP